VSRLIDDIRDRGVRAPWFIDPGKHSQWAKHNRTILDMISPDLPVICANNVAEYYYSGNDQEYWDLTQHFPCLTPPFPAMWIEHRIPAMIRSKAKGDLRVDMPGCRAGVMMLSAKRDNVDVIGDMPDNVEWIVACDVFIDYGARGHGGIDGSPGTIFIAVDKEGAIVGTPWSQTHCAPKHGEQLIQSLAGWLHPAFLAVCFMHCKNVTMDRNEPPPKLAKKYREKHGFDPSVIHTLVIEPMRAVLRKEGRSGEVGAARALHICRGHFRDYRQGAGLFGKYNIRIWQEARVRGTKGEKAPPREIEVKL
jgi:hypothetical protein